MRSQEFLCLFATCLAITAPSGAAAKPAASRAVSIDYGFTILDVPGTARVVRAWGPIPPTNTHQWLVGYAVANAFPHVELSEKEYGNRFLRFDLTKAHQASGRSIPINVRFQIVRRAIETPPKNPSPAVASEANLTRFLQADRLVPIDGKIAAEALEVAGDTTDPLRRARRLYDHIVSTVSYEKSGQGWGRGDAVYACDVRTGNCTDFHSLFIGEARALGIPAKFVMGLPLPVRIGAGEIPGYHCWAEFYAGGIGWVSLDASEASKYPEKHDASFGALDANRIAFTIGRDIQLPEASAGPVNYSIYPHVEVDGRVFAGVETRFSFRDETVGETTAFFSQHRTRLTGTLEAAAPEP